MAQPLPITSPFHSIRKMSPATPYVLIAISNLARAATFKQVAAESLRLECVVVRDGDDAVQEMSKRGMPALLIVDLSLPRVDGFTIVRRVRRGSADMPTQIIAVSAHESLRAAARELSSSLGISGVVPLDVEAPVLREMIFAGLDPSREARRADAAGGGGAAADAAGRDTGGARTNPALDPEEVVDRAAVEIRRRYRVSVSVGYLRAADQEGMTFHLAAREGERPIDVAGRLDADVLRQVAEGTEPLVVANVESHPLFSEMASADAPSIRGFAAVPIASSREHVRAALCIMDTKPLALSATDLDTLAAYGRQVGLELDRVSILMPERKTTATEMPDDIEALQHLASTDPLTGLTNRRGGEKHIANEISRAKREKRPLSCVLIDIDRFKSVNDTYGHQAGDQLLRDVSALLRRTVRAYDILVRWGGEEFLLVLPGVGLDLARTLAERLRMAVSGLDTHGIGQITVSAGAAEFENDYDFASTLRTADRRLYQAKASGRNTVV
jgi:diguanylate cyclase (GGDEF)-like protein